MITERASFCKQKIISVGRRCVAEDELLQKA